MSLFLVSVLLLIIGYAFYGVFIEKVLHINVKAKTPAVQMADGVDYIPLKPYKAFLIQFLNIAGLGPIFGPILGALYGPICLVWIVIGSIFAGGVHDMLAGTMSMRYRGESVSNIAQQFFGRTFSIVFLIMLVFLLLLLGSIFAQTPAHMLHDLTGWSFNVWLAIVFGYYFLATLLPVDKIIGNCYPFFAACLIVSTMSLLLVGILFHRGGDIYPDLSVLNQHPEGYPIFPLMFVTIACGALSGFHATQSPMMARCLTNEKYARPVFYGGMILEGIIALIWATLGISFYHGTAGLSEALGSTGDAGKVIHAIAFDYLGHWGGMITVLSVIILTITSGDTAFRSARLSCADFFKVKQRSIHNRLTFTFLVLTLGVWMAFLDLNKIWIYFGWSNQVLATLVLWLGCLYLRQKKWMYQVALIPAIFMTGVCGCYVGYAPIFLGLDIVNARFVGVVSAIVCTILFFKVNPKQRKTKK